MFPSHWEILVIFLVVLLLFGARRIPEMAQGLGKGIRAKRVHNNHDRMPLRPFRQFRGGAAEYEKEIR